MKKLKQLSMVAVMTLMLAASAFAGDIWIDKAPPPPPPTGSSSKTGDIEIGKPSVTQDLSMPRDSVDGIVLNLLQLALTVF